jgi:3',5'-cyclic AMP phosphodiesterase CpdA
VILLDGNDVSLHAWPAGSEAQLTAREFRDAHAPGAPDWNGGLGFIQLLWLDGQLAEADAAGESAVVMCHYPLLPAGEHVLWNAAEVLAVLRAHPSVKLYLSGHDHDGDYVEQWGVHFLTLRAMLDGPQNAWSVIRLTPREIRVEGEGREPDRVLPLR